MAIDACVVDTNILLRITRRSDPQHQVAHILTLNVTDFNRFRGLIPVHPNQV